VSRIRTGNDLNTDSDPDPTLKVITDLDVLHMVSFKVNTDPVLFMTNIYIYKNILKYFMFLGP